MRSWWVTAVWAVAFALLILNAAVSTYNIDVLIDNDRAVSHSKELTHELDDLLSDVKDAETGERGYLLTRREEYLEPYSLAEAAVPRHLKRVGERAAGRPLHEARLQQLTGLVDEKLAELRATIRLAQPLGREPAREMALTGRGKDTMDRLRALHAEMNRHEEDILAERSKVAGERYKSATFTALIGGGLPVGLGAKALGPGRPGRGHPPAARGGG